MPNENIQSLNAAADALADVLLNNPNAGIVSIIRSSASRLETYIATLEAQIAAQSEEN